MMRPTPNHHSRMMSRTANLGSGSSSFFGIYRKVIIMKRVWLAIIMSGAIVLATGFHSSPAHARPASCPEDSVAYVMKRQTGCTHLDVLADDERALASSLIIACGARRPVHLRPVITYDRFGAFASARCARL